MTSSIPVRRLLPLALALVTALLVMLSMRGAPASASGAQVLHLAARAHMVLRFNTSHLHAHRGRITIIMHNPSNAGMRHGISVEGHGVDRDGRIVAPGHNSVLTVTLKKAGNYQYYCPVPGHKQAGMKGTLRVS